MKALSKNQINSIRKIRKGAICSAHHPRGGVVTGEVSAVYNGLAGRERKICGMSFPASQVWLATEAEKLAMK